MRVNDPVLLRTGVEITRFSLGTAAFGGLYSSVREEDCTATVQEALSRGVKLIDTAPHYGKGVSEERVGRAVRGRDRSQFSISTKVGRLLLPTEHDEDDFFLDANPRRVRSFNFSGAAIRKSLEESLERLALERVEILFIHDPDDHEEQALAEAYPELEKMRSEGLIKAIGIGMNQSRIPTRFIKETDIDCVLIAGRYSLLDQSASLDLLPAALERGVDVIAGGVFNSGILANPDSPTATYDYGVAGGAIRDKVRKVQELIRSSGYSLTSVAMQFPFRHPAVKSVLVGCRSADEVRSNAEGFEVEIEESFWDSLVATL